ncbi:hypothetical protein C1H46_026405, partial [Malus baccata]
ILKEIKHMDFPLPQHLLGEMSNLEVEQKKCDSKNDLAPDAPGESSYTLKRKYVPKEVEVNLLLVRNGAMSFS